MFSLNTIAPLNDTIFLPHTALFLTGLVPSCSLVSSLARFLCSFVRIEVRYLESAPDVESDEY